MITGGNFFLTLLPSLLEVPRSPQIKYNIPKNRASKTSAHVREIILHHSLTNTAEVPGAKQPGDGNKDQDEDEKLKALLCEAKSALFKHELSAQCHKQYAILSSLNIQHSDTFKKIDANYVLKKHLDRFFALGGKDPVCSYLLGRWCYNMATRRELTDTANSYVSYQGSSSIHEALDNFLEADKLSGGSSMRIKLYIAKCYDETGLHFEASALARKALDMRNDSDEDADVLIHELEALIR
uniref:Uncharacterized protein n=1 Tax=Denticeps clupeoides TaxID=299321 RepID=A0AAY4B829_9TELE